MKTDEITIVTLAAQHVDSAASLLAEAFLEDLDVVAIIGRNVRKRRRVLKPYYKNLVNIFLPFKNSTCAMLNGKPVGVMLLTEPGEEPLAFLLFVKFACRMLLHLNPMAVWKGLKSALTDEKQRPKAPHYYVTVLGVHPTYQGCGVGSALLSHLNDAADREARPIYLSASNPNSIRLYERFGYETVSLTSPLGIENHHMEREPQEMAKR